MDAYISNKLIEDIKLNSALKKRTIYINGIIDEDLSFETCYFLNRIKELDCISGNKEPINLIIDSYGGSVISGNAIIGIIENLKNNGYVINAYIQGFAYSMAFDIICCCTNRYGYKYSQYMIHQTQLSVGYGSLIQYKRNIEFEEKQWQQSVDYYLKYTKISKEKIEEIYKHDIDYFMLADEAFDLGVIHEII